MTFPVDSLWSFLILGTLNIAVILWIMYRRSLFSAEGWCMLPLLISVGADFFCLLWTYNSEPETLLQGRGEFDLRLYPTLLHIIGLLVLFLGLHLSDPRPKSICVTLDTEERLELYRLGVGLTVLGLAMFVIAVFLIGGSANPFYANLDRYRYEVVKEGGFWYRGSDIALLGLCFMLVSAHRRWRNKPLLFALIAVTPMVLTSNKGGLEKAVLWAGFALYTYRKQQFKRYARPGVIAIVIVFIVFAIGLKNYLISKNEDITFRAVLVSSVAAISPRYSHEGLYRGYATMVNSMEDGQEPYFDGWVLRYMFTSCVPRIIQPDKEDHPFRAIGYMINPTEGTNSAEVSAPTLVGATYSDYGVPSLIGYMFFGGLFLGFLRRLCTTPQRLPLQVYYIFFCLFGGVSPEAGFIGTASVLLFGAGVIAPVAFFGRRFWRSHSYHHPAAGLAPGSVAVSAPTRMSI